MKEGWKYLPLGDICDFISGYTPKKDELNSECGIPYYKVSDMNRETNTLYLTETELYVKAPKKTIPANSIVFPKNGGAIFTGKKRILKYDSIVDLNTEAIKIKSDKVLLPYLFQYLQLIDFGLFDNGGGLPSINIKKMKTHIIPIPSLPEQQRIVSCLDTEFAKIEALKANAEKQLQAAKDLFQAAIKEMLTPKEGWVEKKLGEIGNICGRIGFRGYTTKDMVSGPNEGAITLSPSNIQDGAMDYTKCQYISWYKYNESPEIMVQNGDVLIVKTGSSYGKSAIVENLPHKATINPQSVVIKKIRINNRLFAYLIRTPWVQNDFDNFVAGTAIPTFSQANLSKVLLTFPQDLNEQQRIADRLDALSANVKALQTNYTETITLCNDLKQALLKKVFEEDG